MAKIKFSDLADKFKDIELDVDRDKLNTAVKFLTYCVLKGMLHHKSPQFMILLRGAMEFAEEEKKND